MPSAHHQRVRGVCHVMQCRGCQAAAPASGGRWCGDASVARRAIRCLRGRGASGGRPRVAAGRLICVGTPSPARRGRPPRQTTGREKRGGSRRCIDPASARGPVSCPSRLPDAWRAVTTPADQADLLRGRCAPLDVQQGQGRPPSADGPPRYEARCPRIAVKNGRRFIRPEYERGRRPELKRLNDSNQLLLPARGDRLDMRHDRADQSLESGHGICGFPN